MRLNIGNIVKAHSPLGLDSLVIDCGGYEGEYSQEIHDKWNPNIIIFEPVPKFYELCKERFKNDNKVKVFPYALGNEVGMRKLYVNKDGTSFYQEWAKSDDSIEVNVVKLSDFIKDKHVDILAMNCEGAEFDILQDLHKNNLMPNIEEILVQFHRVPEVFDEKYDLTIDILKKTHNDIFDFKEKFYFKWQLWRKK